MNPEEIKALLDENTSLKHQLGTEQELSKALQDELSKKLEVAAPADATPKLPKNAKVDKQEFKWLLPSFKLHGSYEPVLAEQANKDPELLRRLVDMGFGGWVPVK